MEESGGRVALCFTSFFLSGAPRPRTRVPLRVRNTPSMAAALATAGLPVGSSVDLADEEVDAALAAAGIRGGGFGSDWPAAAPPHTQVTAGSVVAPQPAPVPPLPRALANVLPPPAAPFPHSFSLDRPVQCDPAALARARERKGPLLLAMMAEHARRGVR